MNRKDDGDGLVGGFALHEAVEVQALQELLLPHKSREGSSPPLSQHLGTNCYITVLWNINESRSSIWKKFNPDLDSLTQKDAFPEKTMKKLSAIL
jgi:hypothetical protein